MVILLGICPSGAQMNSQLPQPNTGKAAIRYPESSNPFGDSEPGPDKRRLRLLNTARQKEIVSETARLLKLAQELNNEVASSDSSRMTGEQLRKVAEIAKLAKSVKEKMSFSVGGFPGAEEPVGR